MLNPDDFKRNIQAIDALGATPAVLVKVTELAQDPNTDLPTICALLRNDGPLAADIIRISNSPIYAPATLHGNLTSAVNQIGLREVVRVVSLSLSRQLFARDLPSYGIFAKDYWSGSAAAALVMEALAKHSGLNPDDAYTIGILHPIGRVLINRVIDEHGFAIFWHEDQPIEEWERGAVGFDYAEAGAMLLEHWRFPTPTCEVVRWQLHPEKVDEQVSALGALQFTRRLIARTGADFKKEGWQLPDADPFVQASGLTQASVSQLVSGCRERFQCIRESLDLA
jgi:HD-like signal output (HDOD) protein